MATGPLHIRVKLCFEDPPLDTPKCLWYLISTESCSFISDVCYSIQKRFLDDKENVSLTMDDCAVPMKESVRLLHDNDVLRVHRQQARSKKRSSDASDSVQEPAKKRKKLKVLCSENTHSPVKSKKSQKLKSNIRKPKSASVTASQTPISPAGSSVAPTLPSSNGTALHSNKVGVPLSGTDPRAVCSGQSVNLDKQLQTSSTETMNVKTVKSRTGGVHKRFTTSSSSDSDSDEAERDTQKGLTTSISNSQDCSEHDKRIATNSAQCSSWDTGKSDKMQVFERDEGTNNHRARSSLRIVGGRKDTFRAVSTVVHVPESAPVPHYDLLPDLCGLPRVGDRIAFKVLEMSSAYSPELSNYKSAVVMCVTPATNTVRLRYTDDTIQQEKKRAVELAKGKFAVDCNEDEEGTGDSEVEVDMNLNELQDMKLMPVECHT